MLVGRKRIDGTHLLPLKVHHVDSIRVHPHGTIESSTRPEAFVTAISSASGRPLLTTRLCVVAPQVSERKIATPFTRRFIRTAPGNRTRFSCSHPPAGVRHLSPQFQLARRQRIAVYPPVARQTVIVRVQPDAGFDSAILSLHISYECSSII